MSVDVEAAMAELRAENERLRARLEAVEARAAFESTALNVAYRRGFNNAMGQIRAALSVAPQPEPVPWDQPLPAMTAEEFRREREGRWPLPVEPATCEHLRDRGHWLSAGHPMDDPTWCPGPVSGTAPEATS